MLHLFLVQLKKRKPIISILLTLGCLLSTIPQFFLPGLYDTATGQIPELKHFYLFTLSSFTHSPEILVNHLIGNIFVLLVFGGITESIIGSSRFALISLLTFSSTSLVNIWHSTDGIAGHGASGIGWGYLVFFGFTLIIIFEIKGSAVFKDFFTITLFVLMNFFIWGIPLLEVFVLGDTFFQNFGQVLHLMSMLTVVPFILLWRKDIEYQVKQMLEGNENHQQNNILSVPSFLLVLILLINLYSTVKTIQFVNKYSDPPINYINPPAGTSITKIPKRIMINFKYPVLIHSERLINTSINYETHEPPTFKTVWTDNHTMEIELSRNFQEKETLMLDYLITINPGDGDPFESTVHIEYK